MSERANTNAGPGPAELFDTTSGFLVGGGILTMALFPLAIPLVALLLIAALPLLAVGVVVATLGAIVAGPVLLARAAWRRLGPIVSGGRSREPRPIGGNRTVMGAH